MVGLSQFDPRRFSNSAKKAAAIRSSDQFCHFAHHVQRSGSGLGKSILSTSWLTVAPQCPCQCGQTYERVSRADAIEFGFVPEA